MIGAVAGPSNRLSIAKMARPGFAGASNAAEASFRKAMADAGSHSRADNARLSGAIADKAGLETIGLLLVLIMLVVISAGALAVRHQPAAGLSQDSTGYGVHHLEGRAPRSVRALGPCITPSNFLI
jgi:hypothetical protein